MNDHISGLFVAVMDLYWHHINWNPVKEKLHPKAKDKFRWAREVGLIGHMELRQLESYWDQYEDQKRRDLETYMSVHIC